MKCDFDGCENEATVHEVTIKGGKKVEKHLCDECARKQGVVVQMSTPPISELLTKFLGASGAQAQEAAAERAACGSCGMTWAKFRQGGLLGCAACYDRFERDLIPLIERAHEGGAQHVGKTPHAAGAEAGVRVRIADLRRRLGEAVQQERYEEAASLRDELRAASEELAASKPTDDSPEPSTPRSASPKPTPKPRATPRKPRSAGEGEP